MAASASSDATSTPATETWAGGAAGDLPMWTLSPLDSLKRRPLLDRQRLKSSAILELSREPLVMDLGISHHSQQSWTIWTGFGEQQLTIHGFEALRPGMTPYVWSVGRDSKFEGTLFIGQLLILAEFLTGFVIKRRFFDRFFLTFLLRIRRPWWGLFVLASMCDGTHVPVGNERS